LGCGSDEVAPGEVLPVGLHTLPGDCELPASLQEGSVELQALGDFPDTNETAEVLPIAERGTALRFPLTTRAIEARIDGVDRRFIGYGERVEAQRRYDVVLWPELQTCSVFEPSSEQGYPGKHGGQALGYAPRHGLVFAAGGNDALLGDAIVGALSFEVTTGAATSFDTSQDSVLREARAFATVSELGDRLLVAGGQNPVFDVPEGELDLRDTAEIFDPASGSFTGELVQLKDERTRHAAVTLNDGSTLLVGGRTKTGEVVSEQRLVEVVSPDGVAKPVATLTVGRIEPRAVRLSDGRIFVGGGYRQNGSVSEPAGEWLTAQGENEDDVDVPHVAVDLPARFNRAFVATPGGGVLAVGGTEDPDADPNTAAYDAWWIDSRGLGKPVTLPSIVAPRPILLPGSDGSAWLIASRLSEPEIPRLFRFNPWAQTFVEADVPPDLRLPPPGVPNPVAIDPDAFVWIEETGEHSQLFGLRLGTRNRYTQDLALVLLSDPRDPTRPLHLVPSRPLRGHDAGEEYNGQLRLEPQDDNDNVTISVADTDYGDAIVRIKLAEESTPPVVVLGDVELGGSACPWPQGAERTGDAAVPSLVRRGAKVELRYQGARDTCTVPTGRLPLALRAGDGGSVITELEVLRGALETR
jgi:hypothetical protein